MLLSQLTGMQASQHAGLLDLSVTMACLGFSFRDSLLPAHRLSKSHALGFETQVNFEPRANQFILLCKVEMQEGSLPGFVA
jgi:hypothetical protein